MTDHHNVAHGFFLFAKRADTSVFQRFRNEGKAAFFPFGTRLHRLYVIVVVVNAFFFYTVKNRRLSAVRSRYIAYVVLGEHRPPIRLEVQRIAFQHAVVTIQRFVESALPPFKGSAVYFFAGYAFVFFGIAFVNETATVTTVFFLADLFQHASACGALQFNEFSHLRLPRQALSLHYHSRYWQKSLLNI